MNHINTSALTSYVIATVIAVCSTAILFAVIAAPAASSATYFVT